MYSCRLVVITAGLLAVCSSQLFAQTDLQPPDDLPVVTLQEIDAVRDAVASSQALEEAAKTTANQSLDQAALSIQAAASDKSETARMQKAIDGAEANRRSIEREAAKTSESAPQIDPHQPLSALQQALVTERGKLADAEKILADASAESSRRQSRLLAIPDQLAALKARREELEVQLEGAVPDAAGSPAKDAAMLKLRAEQIAVIALIDKLSVEQSYFVTTNESLPLERQIAEQKVANLRDGVEQLNSAISNFRRNEILRLREEVEQSVAQAPESLVVRARDTLEILDQYNDISSRTAIVAKQRQEAHERLEEVLTREQTTIDRVEAVGLTEALALLLQNEKNRLQTMRRRFQPDTKVKSEIRDLQILTFQFEDKANELSEQSIVKRLAENGTQSSPRQQGTETAFAETLTSQRQKVLQKATPAGSALFQELVALDTAQRQLQEAIDRYLHFIEEKLLWTRSAPSIVDTKPADALRGFSWLLSADRWAAVPREWVRDFTTAPLRCSMFVLLLVVLFFGASRWRQAIRSETQLAGKRNCVDLSPTLRATAATLLIAAPFPLLLFGIGWIGSQPSVSDEFLASVGYGFLVGAGLLAPLMVLRQMCRVDGLGEGHFGWSSPVCDRVRNACDSAALFGTPLAILAATLRSQPDEAIVNSLGRYCVIAFLLLSTILLHRLLLPSRFWTGRGNSSKTWYRLRRFVYLFAVAIPVVLTILISAGYSYISHAVAIRLLYTSAILLGVLLVESIALRAMMLRRRNLAIEQLQQQRQQAASKAIEGDAALAAGVDVTSPDVDLSSVSLQARQLIRLVALASATALVWMVWADLLPALAMLDRVRLWAVGDPADMSYVTLRDLLFAVVVIGLTIFAVKNLPAVVELLLLQRLPINPGARYAVSTIFRYVLGTVGVLVGLSFLSIPWSQLSWIVAAASVGLGFGLQEILANFVSGIILLLEQPIRVGDIVTVDGTTGVVTKMQIRATTVTNWDRQELVVPNKDLITGKLLNWTLSNVVNRVVIEVGVAYGTDVNEAHSLILSAVASHPEVLDDPAPLVTFEQFGDSSLNFVVRCFLPSLDKRLQTIHELNTSIGDTLEQAGIAVPFPQRDVHLNLNTDAMGVDDVRRAIESSGNPPREGHDDSD